MIRGWLTVAAALITLSLVFFSLHPIVGQIIQMLSIRSGGIIRTMGVGAYGDISCSSSVLFVDWGTVEPGSMKNKTIYLRNEGNVAVTLFLYADNWNPSEVSNYMTLSWDYNNRTIDPLEVVQTTLTLSTSPAIEGITNFSFDIFIGVNE